MTIPKRCIQCGRPITEGRKDRKFCSDVCKNRFHNCKRGIRRDLYQERVQRILIRNYSILERLLELKVTTFDRMALAQMGYDFSHVTLHRKQGGHNLYGCYDIQYELTPTIIKKLRSVLPED